MDQDCDNDPYFLYKQSFTFQILEEALMMLDDQGSTILHKSDFFRHQSSLSRARMRVGKASRDIVTSVIRL